MKGIFKFFSVFVFLGNYIICYFLNINLKWNDVKVPMHIGNAECGYSVMRLMKEIIVD